MRAITADIYTHEISEIAEADTFIDLPDNLMLITEDQWEAEPQPGQRWAGNIPASFRTPVVLVPDEISMRQARLALFGAGLLDIVDTAMNGLPSPTREVALIDWEYATTVRRKSPWIAQLGPALGMTDAQIDQLFIAGAKL